MGLLDPPALTQAQASALFAALADFNAFKLSVGRPTVAAALSSAATTPICFAHRGGANIFPEETLEAMAGASALPITNLFLDYDSNLLSDGGIGAMHDGTVDRTTTSAGLTTDYTVARWLNLQVDAGSWFAPGWRSDLRAPLVPEILERFPTRLHSIESKTTAVLPYLIAEVVRRGMQKQVLINTSVLAHIASIKAAGITSAYYFPDAASAGTPTSVSAALAAGPDVLITQAGTAQADLASLVATGIPILGTATRRWEWAMERAAGCAGVIADDPAYVLGVNTVRTTDSWASKTYGHGQLSNVTNRGRFQQANPATNPGALQLDTPTAGHYLLHGEVSPTAGANKVIDFWVTLPTLPTDTSKFFQLTLADDDHLPITNSAARPHNGYSFNFRADGTLYSYRFGIGDTASTQLGSKTTPVVAWTAGGRKHLRVTITATNVKMENVTDAYSLDVANSLYRPTGGWFLTLGKSDSTLTGVFEVDTLSVA